MPPQDYDPDPAVETAPAKPWHWVLMVVAMLWFSAAATGLWVLWGYENQPGRGAESRAQWPSDSGLAHASDRPTLVMLVHPQCVCSRASLTELAEILARAGTVPRTYVLFLKPRGVADGWEQTDTWRAAAALPGAEVVLDDEGATAARFGGATSGQTFLYDERGALAFSGGVTGSRGHAGDNAGRDSVVALLNRDASTLKSATSVFGCSLFAPGTSRTSNQ
jgi:hypothetical protein